MKQFNWEEFKDENNKIAVHCKTEDEAKDFCRKMHEHDIRWVDAEFTYYDVYTKETCYTCAGYSYSNFCKGAEYKILEWSDYMKNEFTKADLKDGMVVEERNKSKYIVLGDRVLNNDGYNRLKGYGNDLTDIQYSRNFDIIRVFKVKNNSVNSFEHIFKDENLELIWERNEIKHMTVDEIREKLEELTGEKIEVEPSMEEMVGGIRLYCHNKACSSCIINSECSDGDFVEMSKEELKECYEKILNFGDKVNNKHRI